MADSAPRRRRRPPAPDETPPESPQEARREEPKAPPVSAPGKPVTVLQKKLETFLAGMALPFMAAGDMHCAQVLATRAPIVAEAWANLAAESPAVKRALESMLRGGAWAGAIGTTVATVIPIAAHHGAPVPDFISPMIFGGGYAKQESQHEQEGGDSVIVTPPPSSNGNGTAPGPAAVSAPAASRADGPGTDPDNYPGNQSTL